MDRAGAIAQLESGNSRERLEAARFLRAHATTEDRAALEATFRTEPEFRIKNEIAGTLNALRPPPLPASPAIDSEPDDPVQANVDTEAQAIMATARMLVHEVRQVLPSLQLAAEEEIAEYNESATSTLVKRLDEKLEAIYQLSRAAKAPVIADFNLAELIAEVVGAESENTGVTVQQVGLETALVLGDRALISLAVCNGLRNAIEATLELDGPPQGVIINWGATDRGYWLVILDRGSGLPVGSHHAFEIGRTSKSKETHDGMGLSIARQAIESHGGTARLTPRQDGGTAFEISWPTP